MIMKTLVKIQFNKKFNFWEALTAAADEEGNKLQKFGNDYNINATTKKECEEKTIRILSNENLIII